MMIVGVLWREAARFPVALATAVGLLVLVSASYLGQAVAIAVALSGVLGGHAEQVWAAVGAITGIAVLRLVLCLAQSWAATGLGGRVREAVRSRAMARALTRDRLHDSAARDGSLRASLGDGIDGTDVHVAKYIPVVAQLVLVCPLVVLLLTLLSPWAGLAVGIGVLLSLTGPLAWKRMMARRGLDHWDSYEGLSADLLEALRGMATLRTLGDVPGTRRRLDARSEALRRATERVMRASLAETGITDFAIQAGIVAAACAASVHAVTGQAPGLEVYLILLLASEAFRPVRELSRHWHAGFLGLTAVPGLHAIGAFTADAPVDAGTDAPEEDDSPDTRDAGRRPGRRAGELTVRDLSFSYPGAGHAVLEGIDFTARRGRLSAVVGPSGAGKSTFFDLLMGFLTPDTGTLDLDGRTLRRDDVAIVSQRPVLFTDTIRGNLTTAGTLTEAEIVAACRAAGIWAEIAALPHGLDTEVTEAGTSLSGGQRQRLALARALLADRPVLLVDEPTSALDASRSSTVMETLHAVAGERIVIMIGHRPETLEGITTVLRLGRTPADRRES